MERIAAYPCPKCGYSPMHSTAAYALQPGTILKGKYMTGKVLGQGGFGITYIGMDLQLQRKVAIKEYYPAGLVGRKSGTSQVVWYASETAREAMRSGQELVLKEARKMGKVSDIRSVVRVYDVFQENGTAYICMDFIEGQTLLNRLKKTGPLSWEQAQPVFLPIIRAMGQVHQTGLIHRDLSPDNLMIQPDGQVKILDLGAAKDLNLNTGKSSMQVAKNGFSPLEQYMQSGSSGSWTDVYAMAATMYYTLTGTIPPSALDRMDNDAIRWDLPQLRTLPECVLAALKHALTVRPKERTQTMEDFLKELQGEKKPANRKKWLIPAAAALITVVVAAAAIGSLSSGTEGPAPTVGSHTPGSAGPGSSSPAASYSQWKDRVEEVMAACTMETYDYRNGSRMELYFDDRDNECLRIFTNDQGKDEFIILAEYDDDDNMLEQLCFEGQELARKTLWTRNSDGKITETSKYRGNGDLIEKTEIGYDSKGREISRTTVNGAGVITTQGSSTYDAQGRETYSWTNHLGEHGISVYSAEGSILESTTNGPNGEQKGHTVYRYDADGKNTEYLSYDENDQLTYRSEYHFRGKQETGHTSYSYYDGKVYTYEYEYILGPRDIQFGQCYRNDDYSSDTEYVQDIAHNCNVRTFVYQQAPYATAVYDVNHYDWSWEQVYSEGYDADGNLVDKSETLFDENGTRTGSINYNYNPDGSYSVSENDENYSTLYNKEYDSAGNLLSSTEYWHNAKGEQDGYRKLEYNADGSYTQTEVDGSYHTTAVLSYDSSGTLISSAEYSYNSDGKKIRSILTVYYYDGSYTVTEKDSSNKTVSEKTYDRDGKLIRS